MALASTLTIAAQSTLTTALDLVTATVPLSIAKNFNLTDGTGANQADLVWHDQRTLAASATEDLDLAGSLTDPFGTAVAFARIKAIVISADPGNTNNVLVGGAAANGFITWVGAADDSVVIRPGGTLAVVAPDAVAYAVTAATGDLLRIGNSAAGTAVTYDIVVIGASA